MDRLGWPENRTIVVFRDLGMSIYEYARLVFVFAKILFAGELGCYPQGQGMVGAAPPPLQSLDKFLRACGQRHVADRLDKSFTGAVNLRILRLEGERTQSRVACLNMWAKIDFGKLKKLSSV